ncbi:hypothetical protein [Facklamia hominis]|uniref:hypothetical protein n=1 Tax=Facklamia hominis TaxID=178214 RepID=UPI00101D668B|nr:hypothetical protein [Facklamia hominis]RYC97467.1 hypothetical protein EKN08_07960 [Facklamia hominis]
MFLIELGGYAGALLALVSLSQKIYQLIHKVQEVLDQIHQLQEDLASYQESLIPLQKQVTQQTNRLNTLEAILYAPFPLERSSQPCP